MKTKQHVVEPEGRHYAFSNQQGHRLRIPGNVTIAQLVAKGIIVRLHRKDSAIQQDEFDERPVAEVAS